MNGMRDEKPSSWKGSYRSSSRADVGPLPQQLEMLQGASSKALPGVHIKPVGYCSLDMEDSEFGTNVRGSVDVKHEYRAGDGLESARVACGRGRAHAEVEVKVT